MLSSPQEELAQIPRKSLAFSRINPYIERNKVMRNRLLGITNEF